MVQKLLMRSFLAQTWFEPSTGLKSYKNHIEAEINYCSVSLFVSSETVILLRFVL